MFKKIITYTFLSFFIIYAWAGEINWTGGEGTKNMSFVSVASSTDGKKMIGIKQYGSIYTSTDAGLTWIERTSSGQRYWQAVAMSADGAKMTAANKDGYIYTSTDAGLTWIERTSSGQRNWRALAISTDGTKQYALDAPTGYIYASTNSGETWSAKTSSGQRNWQAIATSGDGNKLVAVVKNGFMYKSVNGGGTWTQNTSFPTEKNWQVVFSSTDGNKLVVAESAGNIFSSSDGGTTWIEKIPSGNKGWNSIDVDRELTKIVIGITNENIYTSINSGGTWDEIATSGKKTWTLVSLSGDGKKIYANNDTDGYIFSLAPATISEITSDAVNGTYRPGDVINIDINFSEPVTSTGDVTVTLETGATDRTCKFSITNAKTGTCNYTVQIGDTSNDLTVLTVAGNIKDGGGTLLANLVPTKNLADTKNIKIDNSAAVPVKPVTVTKPAKPTTTTPDDEELNSAPEIIDYGEMLYDPETGETYFPEEEVDIEEPELVLESAPEPVANVDIPVSYRDIDFSTFQGIGEYSPRQEVISIAVRIHRIEITSNYVCKDIYSDTTGYGVSPWTCQFAERSQAAGLISGSRSKFRPLDSVTRAEAYAILLKSACIQPNITPDNWQIGVIETAIEYGLTVRDITSFAPNRPIQSSEVYAVASRVKALLEAHPEMCGD